MSARRKPGRPSQGLTEARVELRAPADLVRAAAEDARRREQTASEWWRQAAKDRLEKPNP